MPIPSVTRGGHMYTYESMHLTKFSRAFDACMSDSLSNQTHPCALLTIALMLAALPVYDHFCKYL